MDHRASDFPFTIMDVAALLRLNIRRRGAGYIYADCPLCGSRRGKLCINLTKNVWSSNCCGESGGMLSLYARVYRISNSEAYREICDELQTGNFAPEYAVSENPFVEESTPQSERAPAQILHQTYSMLLSMLSLSPGHRKHLKEVRGLTDEQIDAFGFKSTPPPYLCRSLTDRLIKQGCTVQGVPGFYLNDKGSWAVKFYQRTSGILIPYRGVDGMLQGFQIRLDRPIRGENDPPDKVGAKYLPLTSAKKLMGTSSGNLLHFVGDPCARVVYVTEGGLKAYIAHALMGRTFAATVGANNTGGLDELFSFLSHNGTEEIIEAEDMDKYSNEGVGKGASKVYQLATAHGLKCRRLTWNPNYKGIDDWQLALRRKEHEHKEMKQMNFKERYLSGLCGLDDIEKYIERWHTQPEDGMSLTDYLGLTEREYNVFLQTDQTASFRELLDSQRRSQGFRVYQLTLSGVESKPFAFRGFKEMQAAGYQQPPAAEYARVYDGEIICPKEQPDEAVLERIFMLCNDTFPEGYAGRSLSTSDVVELYDSTGRRYFYCDTSGFAPVNFSPMLAKKLGDGGHG